MCTWPRFAILADYFVVVVVVGVFAGFFAGVVVTGFVAGIGFAAGTAALDVFTGVRIAALFSTGCVAGRAGVPAFGLAFTILCCWFATAAEGFAEGARTPGCDATEP